MIKMIDINNIIIYSNYSRKLQNFEKYYSFFQYGTGLKYRSKIFVVAWIILKSTIVI